MKSHGCHTSKRFSALIGEAFFLTMFVAHVENHTYHNVTVDMELFLNNLVYFIHIKYMLCYVIFIYNIIYVIYKYIFIFKYKYKLCSFFLFTIVISYSKVAGEYLSQDVLLHSLLPRAYCEPVENS